MRAGRSRALAALTVLALGACAGRAIERSPVAMEVTGDGPVVVFESGLGETQATWNSVRPALEHCFAVVTYDRPGIGNSPPPRYPIHRVLAVNVARELRAELRKRGLPAPYILVGHSIGGLYVQAFARSYPAAVAGLVLVDATSPLEPPGVFVSKVPQKLTGVEAAEDAGVDASMATLLKGPDLPPVPLVVIAATDHADTPEREALWLDVQRRTALLSPQGRLVVVPGGHDVQLDHPASVIAAVLAVAAAAGDHVAACRR